MASCEGAHLLLLVEAPCWRGTVYLREHIDRPVDQEEQVVGGGAGSVDDVPAVE